MNLYIKNHIIVRNRLTEVSATSGEPIDPTKIRGGFRQVSGSKSAFLNLSNYTGLDTLKALIYYNVFKFEPGHRFNDRAP